MNLGWVYHPWLQASNLSDPVLGRNSPSTFLLQPCAAPYGRQPGSVGVEVGVWDSQENDKSASAFLTQLQGERKFLLCTRTHTHARMHTQISDPSTSKTPSSSHSRRVTQQKDLKSHCLPCSILCKPTSIDRQGCCLVTWLCRSAVKHCGPTWGPLHYPHLVCYHEGEEVCQLFFSYRRYTVN